MILRTNGLPEALVRLQKVRGCVFDDCDGKLIRKWEKTTPMGDNYPEAVFQNFDRGKRISALSSGLNIGCATDRVTRHSLSTLTIKAALF
jgi:hypothetical protein